MGTWANLKVKTKVMMLVVLGCLGLAVVAGMGVYVLRQAHTSIGALKEGMEHISGMEEMKNNFLAMRLDIVYLLSLSDRGEIEERRTDYQERVKAIQASIEKNRKAIADPKEKELFESFVTGFSAYLESGGKLGEMANTAALEGRGDRSELLQFATNVVAPLYVKPAAALDELVKINLINADNMYQADTAQGNRLKALLVGIFVVITACALIGGSFIARSINTPLQEVMSALLKVAAGDLTVRTQISSRDELGVLGGEVNQMAERLATAMQKVALNSSQVAAAATQLHTTAEQIATGAEEVAAQAGAVAVASEEMSATSADIANNCQMAADASSQTSRAAVAGSGVVSSTIAGMERIAERVRESADTVVALGARSDQIGAIVATIEDIADQTNLLALNAAIEAARAGEMGRGFAVVADEVRALAERTTKATREIGEMIKSIQSETKVAVNEMGQGVHEVEQGVRDAASSGQALEEILAKINEVDMQVNQVATAAEEQTATTTEITNNIQQISQVVQQTATGAHQTVQAANQLSQLSDELRALVGQFKI